MSVDPHIGDMAVSEEIDKPDSRNIGVSLSPNDAIENTFGPSYVTASAHSTNSVNQEYKHQGSNALKIEQDESLSTTPDVVYQKTQTTAEHNNEGSVEMSDVVEIKSSSQTEMINEARRSDSASPSRGDSSIESQKLGKDDRLVIIYDKPRYTHIKTLLVDLKKISNDVTVVELNSIGELSKPEISNREFKSVHICIEHNNEFESNMDKMNNFLIQKPKLFEKVDEVSYHFQFDPKKSWQSDYSDGEKQVYSNFLDNLNSVASDKVVQCSIINKYEIKTIYLTAKEDLEKLGKEIQSDISHWTNLKTFDYRENCIRFLPGIKFPSELEIINIGGNYSLETLSGFKMPLKLKVLIACEGSISSIDNINFPPTLERVDLSDNKIYFLNYAEFPQFLRHLDLSQNRIDNIRGVNFPRALKTLSIARNPIECIKGVRFPEGLLYLDVSMIPNESMTGVKFPDSLISLNLQESMTNTRGLKLPTFLKEVNLGGNGVNSINPLKLPNSIEVLYLNNNNIKTLNKVQFPTALKELYLGNNLITTLKNVQFPPGLEVLDMEMDPSTDDNDKHITTLKDVIFPPKLKVLRLGYHALKSIESIEFPFTLRSLGLSYNELKVIRNVRFGPNLVELDLSGNQSLTNIDALIIPDSTKDLKVPPQLINNLPASIVERANKHEIVITKSLPY